MTINKIKILKLLILIVFSALVYSAILNPNIPIKYAEGALLILSIIILNAWHEKSVQLKLLKQNYRQRNEILSDIFKNSPDLIYYKDVDYKYLGSNVTFAELHNETIHSIIGKTDNEIIPDSAVDIREHDREIIQTGKIYRYEQTLRHRNGENRIYQIIKTPLHDSSGQVSGILGIARDITEFKEIEEQRETFVETLTHDLKTPTTAQIKTIELLLNNTFGEITPLQREILIHILNSCKYMFNMISTVLTTYKYENGNKNFIFSDLEFGGIVKEACKELNSLVQEKNINLIIEIPEKNILVNADHIEIKRVVVNLISNAISYSLEGSEIRVVTKQEGEKLVFKVHNNSSILISKEECDTLFTKFCIGNKKFRPVGTGLGLYLSKKIIEEHRGKMIVSVDENSENIFGFEIDMIKSNVLV